MFIKRMLELMKEQKITKKQIATDLDFGINQIKYWETHGNVPNAEIVNRIAEYLNCSVDYLLCKTDKKVAPTVKDSERKQELMELFSHLDENSQAALIEVARHMKKPNE